MARDRGDQSTSDIFAWEPPQVAVGYSPEVTGRGELQSKISRLVGRALRDAKDERGITRAKAAVDLSVYLGRTVSEDMLDKWASEASDQHRIPLDAFIGLVEVTGATDLLGFIPGLFGFVVIDRKYEAIVELQLLEEHERDVNALKARLQAKVRGR